MALPYVEVPFTNSFGQTINPDQEVAIVTSGYGHSVHTAIGIFLGMRNGCCVVRVKKKRYTYDDKWNRTGEEEYFKQTTLQLNRIFPTTTPISEFAGKGVF